MAEEIRLSGIPLNYRKFISLTLQSRQPTFRFPLFQRNQKDRQNLSKIFK